MELQEKMKIHKDTNLQTSQHLNTITKQFEEMNNKINFIINTLTQMH
jgi:hypothetical protein